MVDAAEHEVRPFGHQRLDREHHAVGRRAVDLEAPLGALHRAERVMQRQRVAHRALFAVRRDDGHLAQGLRRLDQAVDAVGEDAVVVRDQEAHRAKAAGRWFQIVRMTDAASRKGLKWLGAPYSVATGTEPMRNPALAARIRKAVSNSYLSPVGCTVRTTSVRIARNPDWLSGTRCPVQWLTATADIRFVRRLPSGIPRSRRLAPITMSAPSRASRSVPVAAGSCWPSASMVTTAAAPREIAMPKPARSAAPFPRFAACMTV